jgi:hypothetical protein
MERVNVAVCQAAQYVVYQRLRQISSERCKTKPPRQLNMSHPGAHDNSLCNNKTYLGLHVNFPIASREVNQIWDFSRHISTKSPVSNFTEMLSVGAALITLRADREADRHDEGNGHFSRFCEHAQKPAYTVLSLLLHGATSTRLGCVSAWVCWMKLLETSGRSDTLNGGTESCRCSSLLLYRQHLSSPLLQAYFRPYCGGSLRRRWHFTFPAMIQTADLLYSSFSACLNGISEIVLEFKSSSQCEHLGNPSVVCRRNQVFSMRNLNFNGIA